MHEPSESLVQLTDVRQRLAALEKRLKDELAESEQLQRQLALRNAALDVGTSHFMIVDACAPKRTMAYVNRALAHAHGYEPAELIGRGVGRLLKPGSSPGLQAEMEAALANGQQYRAEIEAVRRDGSTFWVGFTSIGLRDGRGEVSHIVTVAADITSRREAELKRKELQEQLLNEMRERERMAIELRLAQKLESVGRLAAGLAHEINTPIQYVCDSVHFLRTGFDDLIRLLDECRNALGAQAAVPAGVRESIAAIEKEIDYEFLRLEVPRAFERTLEGTDRVAGLVRAMKEFAHPDTNEHSPADLNHALQTTLTVCRNEYKYLAQLVTDLDELPSIMCNIGELNQVFLNLIVNAAHGIQDAGKDLADGCIRVTTRLVGENVEVTIADNGCGIAAENVDKIFDPFFTTKEIGRGTGQGLSIARTIVVDKHRGDIRVQSERGAGTIFTIVLPIAPRAAEAA
jgi:two-component system, NtrC family, sensor kinase